jgi:hypothetical protein
VNRFHDPLAAELRSSLQETLLDVLVGTEDRFQPRVSDF